MASLTLVHVPKYAFADVDTILNTPTAKLHLLAERIAATPLKSDVEDLAEACAEGSGIPANKIESILSVAVNMCRIRRRLVGVEEDILTIFGQSLDRHEYPAFKEGERGKELYEERRAALSELIKADNPVDIMSKARDLLTESQCVVDSAIIVTDTRHVYGTDPTRILGGLVLHTLSLEYEEGKEERSLHLTLSSKNVNILMESLKRALSKEKAARKLLEDQNLPELTPKRNVT